MVKKFSFRAHILRGIYAKKKKQTPSGQTGCLSNPESLLAAQESLKMLKFFNSLPLPNTVSEATSGTLPFTVQHLYDLQDTIQLHWSPSTFHPTFT